MSRVNILGYYITTTLYLWILCTPLVSFVFGSYLYISSRYMNAHMTEAFSSLRIENYKVTYINWSCSTLLARSHVS